MLDRSWPASWTVRRARDAYLAENGFTLESYEDAWMEASFLGLAVPFPNTKKRRSAVRLHDLHHVATGFGTDFAGEGEVSAWELRRELTKVGPYVGMLVLLATFLGIVTAPRRTFAAWRASSPDGRSRASLFARSPNYESMLDGTVGQLREVLGIPQRGLAGTRGRHSRAPHHVAV